MHAVALEVLFIHVETTRAAVVAPVFNWIRTKKSLAQKLDAR
jgi:hypothetical protein